MEHRRGVNLPSIGGFNRTVVLEAIRRSDGGLSRVELVGRTGLSTQTVSNVVRYLLDVGMVVESGTVISGRGKPRTLVRLRERSRYAVGIHVDPAMVTYVVLDLAGTVVARAQTATPGAAAPEEVVATMASAVAALLDGVGVAPGTVMGVGIASPGPVDTEAGSVLDPPFLPRWRDVPLRTALASATRLPVLLEKDVIAAAVGEQFLAGDPPPADFAFVYYGTGFGIGLVVGNEPLRGVGANAGDAGHILIDQGTLAFGSTVFGEVGATVAPDRIVSFAADTGVLPALEGLAASSAGIAVVDRAWDRLGERLSAGESGAVRLAAGIGAAMGRAAVTVVNLLDLDRVVFGGPFWGRIASAALPAAAAVVSSSPVLVPKHAVALVSSMVGEDVAAVGAGCLVFDAALGPRAGALRIAQ